MAVRQHGHGPHGTGMRETAYFAAARNVPQAGRVVVGARNKPAAVQTAADTLNPGVIVPRESSDFDSAPSAAAAIAGFARGRAEFGMAHVGLESARSQVRVGFGAAGAGMVAAGAGLGAASATGCRSESRVVAGFSASGVELPVSRASEGARLSVPPGEKRGQAGPIAADKRDREDHNHGNFEVLSRVLR